MMSVDGKVDVRCSVEDAWDLFCRFGDVAKLIPTVQDVEIDGDVVDARVEVKLGALPVSSRIYLEVTERKPLERLAARGVSYLGETLTDQMKKSIDGVDAGSAGHFRMHLDLRPSEIADCVTVSYHAEVDAEGRLKRIYEAILKTKVPTLMEEFADNIRGALERERPEEVAAAEQPAATEPAEPPQPAPSAAPPSPAGVPAVEQPPASAAARQSQAEALPQPVWWARLLEWLRGLLDWLRELIGPIKSEA